MPKTVKVLTIEPDDAPGGCRKRLALDDAGGFMVSADSNGASVAIVFTAMQALDLMVALAAAPAPIRRVG
jgi:hypothetical protein